MHCLGVWSKCWIATSYNLVAQLVGPPGQKNYRIAWGEAPHTEQFYGRMCRDDNVLYFMNIYSIKWLSVASRHSPPRFPLGQKMREHVQEALVKETVLKDEVAGSEQRGCSLLEEMSVIPRLFGLSYIVREELLSHASTPQSSSHET
jgi:hypothetical protein